MFERGKDVIETLSLGRYSGISKRMRDLMESVLSGMDLWSTQWIHNTYQVEPAQIIHENKPDRGGGNNHKFYSYVSLNDFKNCSSMKDLVRNQSHTINRVLREEGFKIVVINYYAGSKPIRKAGFELIKNGLLVEIVYAEVSKK